MNIKNNKLWCDEGHMNIDQEMPPIFIDDKTRCGDDWSDDTSPTEQPLLPNSDKLNYQEYFSERHSYILMCYLELG